MIVTVTHQNKDYELEFPDDMPQDQIRTAIDKQFKPQQPEQKSVAGFVGNAIDSTGNLIKNTATGIGTAIAHPVDTGETLAHLAQGELQKIGLNIANLGIAGYGMARQKIGTSLLGETPAEAASHAPDTLDSSSIGDSPLWNKESNDIASKFNELQGNRWGSVDKALNTLYTDPVGAAADLSVIAGLGKSALRFAGMNKAANVAGKISETIDPIRQLSRGVGASAKWVNSQVLGRTTGSGTAVLKKAAEASPEFMTAMRTGDDQYLVEKTQDAFDKMKQARGDEYRSALENVTESKSKIKTDELSKVNDDLLNNFKVQRTPEGELNFTYSRLRGDPEAVNQVKEITDAIKDWRSKNPGGELSPSELDDLRKTIGDIGSNPKLGRNVAKIKSLIADKIESAVPGYKNMNSRYEEASRLIEGTQKAILSKDPRAVDTVLRKITMGVREEKGLRRTMLEELKKYSGKDIAAIAAGNISNAWMGRRLESLGPLVSGAYHLLPFASPRLAAEVTAAISRLAKVAAKTPRSVSLGAEQLGQYQNR
jgi:hypothetical protein